MVAGRIVYWEKLEFKIACTGSGSGSGNDWASIWTASGYTGWTPDTSNLNTGLIVTTESAKSQSVPAGSCTSTLVVTDLGISESYSHGSYQTSVTQEVILSDVYLYMDDNPYWQLYFSDLVWKVNGTTRYTHGADSIEGTVLTPAGIPLFGVPFTICADCDGNGADVEDPDPWSYASDLSVVGGWRFKEDGVYYTLPVTVSVLAPPDCDLCAGTPTPPDPTCSATNTYDGTVSATSSGSYSGDHAIGDTYECSDCPTDVDPTCHEVEPAIWEATGEERSSEACSACLTLMPDLVKSVVRMGDATDYAALIYRAGLPYSWASSARQCMDVPDEGPSPLPEYNCSADDTDELFPGFTVFLSTVTNSDDVIEDPFDIPTYAPYSITSGAMYNLYNTGWSLVQPQICETALGDPCPTLPGWVSDCVAPADLDAAYQTNEYQSSYPTVESSASSNILAQLDHDVPLAVYVNTNCNPHWSYCLWFQNWEVDGDEQLLELYWVPVREQWLYNSLLAEADQRRTRNHIVSEPLMNGQLASWMESTWFGFKTSWWGISRWTTQTVTPVDTTLDTDSSSLWTDTDGSLTFGAGGITVAADPAGAGAKTVTVDLDLGSFDYEPFMLPHICDRVVVDWVATNITSVTVKVLGQYGSEATLGTTPGTYPIIGTDNHYAGSWAQDLGQGMVTDEGADAQTYGRSAVTMADAELSQSFNLLAGKTAKTLRFVVVLTDGTSTGLLKWPQFLVSDNDGIVIQEQGFDSSIHWEDGPGVRFGQWEFYDPDNPGTLYNPPQIPQHGAPPLMWHSSALDGLCWKHLVLQGKAAATDLDTDIAAVFDAIEGQTRANADSGTLSFLIPKGTTPIVAGHLALVNSLRECPPLAVFPNKARATGTWQPTGGHAQKAYSYVVEPRRLVSPSEVHLKVGASYWTATDATYSVPGWEVTKHSHTVDNTESGANITYSGKTLANVRPWHGWFAVPARPSRPGTYPAYDVSYGMIHYRAFLNGGTAWTGYASQSLDFTDSDTGLAATSVAIKVHRRGNVQTVVLLIEQAGSIKQYTSPDGVNWTLATTIATGSKPDIVIGTNGLRYIYWIDGTDVKGQIRDAANTVVVSTFTALSGVDDAGIKADESFTNGGVWRIVLLAIVSGSVTEYVSLDGKNFS